METLERIFTTHSAEMTRKLGHELGKRLLPGSHLLLSGDLGSGKTVFVQGLGKGLQVPDDCYINSPTYTLINEYPARLPFFHIDLFRLEGGADLEDIGILELFTSPNVVAVEWPERLHPSEVPSDHCKLQFKIKNESIRTIHIIACGLRMIDLVKDIPLRELNFLRQQKNWAK